jgi:hypothetical protein
VAELQVGKLRMRTTSFMSVLFTNVPTGHAASDPGLGQRQQQGGHTRKPTSLPGHSLPELGQRQQQGDDNDQNCQEAHGEAIGVEDIEQPGGCQINHHCDRGHGEPERDTLELQVPRSLSTQRHPSVAGDWSAIQQVADGSQGIPTHIVIPIMQTTVEGHEHLAQLSRILDF